MWYKALDERIHSIQFMDCGLTGVRRCSRGRVLVSFILGVWFPFRILVLVRPVVPREVRKLREDRREELGRNIMILLRFPLLGRLPLV